MFAIDIIDQVFPFYKYNVITCSSDGGFELGVHEVDQIVHFRAPFLRQEFSFGPIEPSRPSHVVALGS